MRDWANAIRPYNFSHHSVGANRIRPRLYSPPFAFVHVYIHPIIIRLYHYFIEQMPIGRMRFAPTLAYIYYSNPVRANRIRPNQHSPQFSFILIYIFHHFIQFMGEFDSPLHIFTHTYLAFRTGESHSPPNISALNIFHHFIQFNGRMRFAPTLAHIYILFKSRMGESHSPQSAFAPIFIHPNIYIPSFHPFNGRMRFAPIYFPTTSRINLKTPLHIPQKT